MIKKFKRPKRTLSITCELNKTDLIRRLNKKWGSGYFYNHPLSVLELFSCSKKTFKGKIYQNEKIKYRPKLSLLNILFVSIIAKGILIEKENNTTQLNIRIEMSKFSYWLSLIFFIAYLVITFIIFIEMFLYQEAIIPGFETLVFLTIIIFFSSIIPYFLTQKKVDKMALKTELFIKSL